MNTRAYFAVFVIVIGAGITYLFMNYVGITGLKGQRKDLDTQIAQVRNQLESMEMEYHDLQMIRLKLNETELTTLADAELDYSKFVDMLRSKKISVQSAEAPKVVDAEGSDLKTEFPIATAQVTVYEEVTIKQVIELMELVADDPHFVRLDMVDIGGGKEKPSYRLTFHMLYGINPSTLAQPERKGPPRPVPPTPPGRPAGGAA